MIGPQCLWYQSPDHIFLSVKLPKVNRADEGEDYKLLVTNTSIELTTATKSLKLQFYDSIVDNNVQTKISGPSVNFTFEKVIKNKPYWPRITHGKAPSHIKVDWDKWVDEDDQKFTEEDKQAEEEKERAAFNKRWMDSAMDRIDKGVAPERPQWRKAYDEIEKVKEAKTASRIAKLNQIQFFLHWSGTLGFHFFIVGSFVTFVLYITYMTIIKGEWDAPNVCRTLTIVSFPVGIIDLMSSWQNLDRHCKEPYWRSTVLLFHRGFSGLVLISALVTSQKTKSGVNDNYNPALILFFIAWAIRPVPQNLSGLISALIYRKADRNGDKTVKWFDKMYWWVYVNGLRLEIAFDGLGLMYVFSGTNGGMGLFSKKKLMMLSCMTFLKLLVLWVLHTRTVVRNKVRDSKLPWFNSVKVEDPVQKYLDSRKEARRKMGGSDNDEELIKSAKQEIHELKKRMGQI